MAWGVARASSQRATVGAVGGKLPLGVGRALFVLGGCAPGEPVPCGCWAREQARNKPGSSLGHDRRHISSHASA